MEIVTSETFQNFTILNKALLFLIKLNKTAVQSKPKFLMYFSCLKIKNQNKLFSSKKDRSQKN